MPTSTFMGKSFNYTYPYGLDLNPNSEFHGKLLRFLLDKIDASFRDVSNRYPLMQEIDNMLNVFIPLDIIERRAKNKDPREPVHIVVPEMHAILETLLTYMMAVYSDSVIFKYAGVGSEDTYGAALMERLIDFQAKKQKMLLNLYAFWRDVFSYGRGYIMPHWKVIKGSRMRRRRKITKGLDQGTGLPIETTKFLDGKPEIVPKLLYEGNELININPYGAFPDSSVAAGDLQKGTFFASADRTNWITLMENEQDDPKFNFNMKYLQEYNKPFTSRFVTSHAEKDRTFSADAGGDQRIIDTVFLELKLIPSEHDMGDSKDVERWEFGISGDKLITSARKLEDIHGKLNVVEAATEFDGKTAFPISKLETVFGLQEVENYMFNSRVLNNRMTINSGWLIDPMMVNEDDLHNPGPGMVVRMVEQLWGRGNKVTDFLQPLVSPDVTANNITVDVPLISQIMRTSSGAEDSALGVVRSRGERISATEVSGARSSVLSRLARMAMIISLQAHQDLAEMMALNVQQYMTESTYIRTAGNWERDLKDTYNIKNDRLKITPFDLLIDFDTYPGDTLSTGAEDLPSMMQIFQIVGANENLAQQFDIFRMVRGLARVMGFKNINDFITENKGQQIVPNIASQESIARGVEKGNLVSA